MTDKTHGEFMSLLNRCKIQAERDPAGYTANPHLYEMLHKVYLRLCHGNIPEFGISEREEKQQGAR